MLLLEEKRLLVAAKKFALWVLDLFLQHTKVGVHDGLLQDGILGSVFADAVFP